MGRKELMSGRTREGVIVPKKEQKGGEKDRKRRWTNIGVRGGEE